MLNVKVDRLDIRLNGLSPQVTNGLANDLGKDLLRELAARSQTYQSNLPIKIDKIDLGVFETKRNSSPSDLKTLIVSHVAEAIHSKVEQTKRGDGTMGVDDD